MLRKVHYLAEKYCGVEMMITSRCFFNLTPIQYRNIYIYILYSSSKLQFILFHTYNTCMHPQLVLAYKRKTLRETCSGPNSEHEYHQYAEI